MADEPTDAADHQPLASVESNLFGSLIGFHGRIRMLIRDAELDAEEEQLAAERVGKLLAGVTDEVVRTKNFDMQHRLDEVYDKLEPFVTDLAKRKSGNG